MNSHTRTTIDDQQGGGLASPGAPRPGALSNATKARIIVLLALLAIALSAYAVIRVATRSTEEPSPEAVSRAAAIEMQLREGQPTPPPGSASGVQPGSEGRRRGGARATSK